MYNYRACHGRRECNVWLLFTHTYLDQKPDSQPLHLRLSFREGAAYFLEHCSFTFIYVWCKLNVQFVLKTNKKRFIILISSIRAPFNILHIFGENPPPPITVQINSINTDPQTNSEFNLINNYKIFSTVMRIMFYSIVCKLYTVQLC